MKGQMEFIIILGILFVVVIVAFYAIQGGIVVQSPVPSGVYEEQKDVSDSVRGVMRDAVDNTLKTMMKHGGYLDSRIPGVTKTYEDVDCVEFLSVDVPFWQQCSNKNYPTIDEVEGWMEASIREIVLDGLGDIELAYGDRAIFKRSGIDVSVDVKGDGPFEPDMIDVALKLPTKVRNYSMSSDLYPYRERVETKFGRIYAFARDFAEASAQNRYFDVFTISAIYFSKEMGDGHPKLPTSGAMTSCGEVVYRSPQEINEYLYEIVEYVMVSTEWWKPMSPATNEPKAFAIQDLEGETYPDLEVRTLMADDWVFDLLEFVFATNFEMPSHGGFTIPVCTAVYNQAYNFSYPFILRVKDPHTGYSFNFASMVGIHDRGDEVMEPAPGGCGFPGAGQPGCTDAELQCSGKVRVLDELGEGLEGAWVVFGGCPIGGGETDENGYVEGPVKCGSQELFVYKDDGYEFLKRVIPATEIEPDDNYQVTLNHVNEIRVHFKEVSITEEGFYYDNQNIRQQETCDACQVSGTCDIDTLTMKQCSIGPVTSDYAFVNFDNGYMNLPVTNVDVDSIPEDCMDTDECRFCEEHANEAETADAAMRDIILGNCTDCYDECYTPPLTSVLVGYLPSGYAYEVDAIMYDAFDYMPSGGFLYSDFELGSGESDVYVYIPMRAGNRRYAMEDAEKRCLSAAMQECEIAPVSTEEYVDNTLILPGCDCGYLKAVAVSCGASNDAINSMFCDCPAGGVYPGDCGSCGPLDQCTDVCCDKDYVLSYLERLECQTRVICT